VSLELQRTYKSSFTFSKNKKNLPFAGADFFAGVTSSESLLLLDEAGFLTAF
jgi:hypothetical protein